MTAKAVRDTLAEETVLLDIMIGCLQTVDSKRFTQPNAQFIHQSWIRFLRERRHAGVTLQQMKDADLLTDLTEEGKQVDAYIAQTKSPRVFSEQWDEFLNCEKKILDDLIHLYHQP